MRKAFYDYDKSRPVMSYHCGYCRHDYIARIGIIERDGGGTTPATCPYCGNNARVSTGKEVKGMLDRLRK